ncbi:MAG: threonine synthase [Candidatus Micrarchaeia archaeon]
MDYWFECAKCKKKTQTEFSRCECGGLAEVQLDLSKLKGKKKEEVLDSKTTSGVWRYKAFIHPGLEEKFIVSRGEGNTFLYSHERICQFTGLKQIRLKHEGENPTGSFKDRGMTVGVTEAKRQGAKAVACASTGNTSSSLASYAAFAGMECQVFLPKGKVAAGKLAQTKAYGAKIIEVEGSFDKAMDDVEAHCQKSGVYLLNSINPWRIQGQKTIVIELMEQNNWDVDWIVLPAGNLGNTTAFCKALLELKELGWISKLPRIAAIQAHGANPFYQSWKAGKEIIVEHPETIASAIRIGNPKSLTRGLAYLKKLNGVVEEVTDEEIIAAKHVVDGCGIGCEPASAASVAGAKKLVAAGVIKKDEKVVGILTGNLLKDPTEY